MLRVVRTHGDSSWHQERADAFLLVLRLKELGRLHGFRYFYKRSIGFDVVLSSEELAAEEILNTVAEQNALEVEHFAARFAVAIKPLAFFITGLAVGNHVLHQRYGPGLGMEGKTADKQADDVVLTCAKALTESLINSSDVFAAMPYFLSAEFSLLDCSIAPILWRLPYYGIELPKSAKQITAYMKRVFSRPSFQAI